MKKGLKSVTQVMNRLVCWGFFWWGGGNIQFNIK